MILIVERQSFMILLCSYTSFWVCQEHNILTTLPRPFLRFVLKASNLDLQGWGNVSFLRKEQLAYCLHWSRCPIISIPQLQCNPTVLTASMCAHGITAVGVCGTNVHPDAKTAYCVVGRKVPYLWPKRSGSSASIHNTVAGLLLSWQVG